jgi:hypothetical protein
VIGGGGVAEHFRDHLHRHPLGQHEAGGSMSSVMEPDAGQLGLLYRSLEPARKRLWMARCAQLVSQV